MIITRQWAMPNKNTFDIKPIKEIINKYLVDGIIIDPFANKNKIAFFKKLCFKKTLIYFTFI